MSALTGTQSIQFYELTNVGALKLYEDISKPVNRETLKRARAKLEKMHKYIMAITPEEIEAVELAWDSYVRCANQTPRYQKSGEPVQNLEEILEHQRIPKTHKPVQDLKTLLLHIDNMPDSSPKKGFRNNAWQKNEWFRALFRLWQRTICKPPTLSATSDFVMVAEELLRHHYKTGDVQAVPWLAELAAAPDLAGAAMEACHELQLKLGN